MHAENKTAQERGISQLFVGGFWGPEGAVIAVRARGRGHGGGKEESGY